MLHLPLPPLARLGRDVCPSPLSRPVRLPVGPGFLDTLLHGRMFFCSRVCTPCRTTAVGLEEKERVEVDLACRSRAAGRSVPLVLCRLGNQLFPERLLYAFLCRICGLSGFHLSAFSGRLYPPSESSLHAVAFPFARGHRKRGEATLCPGALPFRSFFTEKLPASQASHVQRTLFRCRRVGLYGSFLCRVTAQPRAASLAMAVHLCP